MKKSTMLVAGGVCVAAGLLMLPWQGNSGTAFAQAKGNNKEEARLRNQVKDLQQDVARLKRELAEREQALNKLRTELRKENLDDVKDQVSLKMLRDKDQLIAKLQAETRDALATLAAYRSTKAVHAAFYKPKSESTAAATMAFINDANTSLSRVRGVRGLWVGRAAGDSDFHVALVVLFDDADALQKFRDDTQVQQFQTRHAKEWIETVREFVRGK